MNKKARLALLLARINKLENSPKNIKCPGVLNKLYRRLERGNY